MTVDVHTHVWQSPEQWGAQIGAHLRQRSAEPAGELDASTATHSEAIATVDAAFVLGFRSRMLGADVGISAIAAYIASAPGRLIGFAGIDPMEDGSVDLVESLPSQSIRGVVISPSEQGYHPAHTRAMRLYEKCQSMGLVIIVHQGEDYVRDSMLEFAQPYLLDSVAREFPQLKLLLTHCGHPWTDQAMTLLAKHRNVYAELSGLTTRPRQLHYVLMLAHQLEVTDRLLCGSDFPRQTPKQAISAIYSLTQLQLGTSMPGVPREKLRSIVERDAISALGLESRVHKSALETARTQPRPNPIPQTSDH
jgi:uncharacterized protein